MLDHHFKKEEFKESVKENVKMLYRKTIEEATQEQVFQAVSLTVKDVVIDNWLLTQKQYEKDDPKIVYYLSMEFLIIPKALHLAWKNSHETCRRETRC